MGYLELGVSGYLLHFAFYILWQIMIILYFLTLNKKDIFIWITFVNALIDLPLYYLFKEVDDPFGTNTFFIVLFLILTILYIIARLIINKDEGFNFKVIYRFQEKMFKSMATIFKFVGVVCFILFFLELYFFFNTKNQYIYRSIFMMGLLIINGVVGIVVGRKFITVIRKKFPDEITEI